MGALGTPVHQVGDREGLPLEGVLVILMSLVLMLLQELRSAARLGVAQSADVLLNECCHQVDMIVLALVLISNILLNRLLCPSPLCWLGILSVNGKRIKLISCFLGNIFSNILLM